MGSVQASVKSQVEGAKPREPLRLRVRKLGSRFLEWMGEPLEGVEEKKVRIFTREEPVDVSVPGLIRKIYVGYEIAWCRGYGGCTKWVPNSIAGYKKTGSKTVYVVMSPEEIEKFRADVQAEARDRKDIREFLERYPDFLKSN